MIEQDGDETVWPEVAALRNAIRECDRNLEPVNPLARERLHELEAARECGDARVAWDVVDLASDAERARLTLLGLGPTDDRDETHPTVNNAHGRIQALTIENQHLRAHNAECVARAIAKAAEADEAKRRIEGIAGQVAELRREIDRLRILADGRAR